MGFEWLISFLILVLVFCIIGWGIKVAAGALQVPPAITQVVLVILALIFLLQVLGTLGYAGGFHGFRLN